MYGQLSKATGFLNSVWAETELKSSVGIRAANELLRRALGTGKCIMRKSGYSM